MSNDVIATVIIPIFDDWPRLQLCLRSLERQQFPTGHFEVIVVDNAAEHAPPPLSFRGDLRILHEPRPGSYTARNKGVAAARGEVLAFTDSDCLPEPNWLSAGFARLRLQPELCYLAGRVELFPKRADAANLWELYDMASHLNQKRYSQSGFAATANMFVRSSTFRAVGLFNDQLFSGADAEWGGRARTQGIVCAYASDALVRHPCRDTRSEIGKKVRRTMGGRIKRTLVTRQSRLLLVATTLVPPFLQLVRATTRPGMSRTQRAKVVLVLLLYVWPCQTATLARTLFHREFTR